MLVIKLSKTGKTNKKVFRLIISEKGRDPYGNVLEILGSYNPYSKELVAKNERINYWLSKGAQMTASVNNLLVEKKVITGKKVVASKPGKVSEKRLNQAKAKAEKKGSAAATEAAEAADVKEEKMPEEASKTEVKEEKATEEVVKTEEEKTAEETVKTEEEKVAENAPENA